MDLENILSRIYDIKKVKEEVNNNIKDNVSKINADKLEIFDFIHKLEKIDLMIDSLIDEIKMEKEEENKAQVDKNEFLSAFNLKRNKEEEQEYIDESKNEDDIKCYNIGDKKDNLKICVEEDDEEKSTNSIEEAYKRIAKLEKLMDKRRLIERDEELSHMKDIHSKEERDEMLGKRKIIVETFTPKSKEQSEPGMDKTVAMSKEEFYKEIDNSTQGSKLIESEKSSLNKKSDEHSKSSLVNMDYTAVIDMDQTAILDFDHTQYENNHSDEKNDEKNDDEDEYDIYNEEKGSGIFDKVKDFLGK